MKHSLPFFLLSVPLLVGTGCSKTKPEELPKPQATATYSRAFFYPATSALVDTTYAAPLLRAVAGQDANELSIGVGNGDVGENINFRLERSRWKPGLVGSYTLKTQQNLGLGDASITYFYPRPTDSGISGYMYFSSANRITGTLNITGFNAASKLVSGTYTVELANASDPTAAPTTFPKERCNITLTGSFDNVVIAE